MPLPAVHASRTMAAGPEGVEHWQCAGSCTMQLSNSLIMCGLPDGNCEHSYAEIVLTVCNSLALTAEGRKRYFDVKAHAGVDGNAKPIHTSCREDQAGDAR
jgi:hypothetical protein